MQNYEKSRQNDYSNLKGFPSKKVFVKMASVAAKHSLNFSFSGCGFLGMYHLGAVARLKDGQIGNQDLFEIKSALGASAGALGKLISRNSTDIVFNFTENFVFQLLQH